MPKATVTIKVVRNFKTIRNREIRQLLQSADGVFGRSAVVGFLIIARNCEIMDALFVISKRIDFHFFNLIFWISLCHTHTTSNRFRVGVHVVVC